MHGRFVTPYSIFGLRRAGGGGGGGGESAHVPDFLETQKRLQAIQSRKLDMFQSLKV